MKILLTGISSFTGYWFAKELVAAGHQVSGTLTGIPERYDGVRGRRVRELAKICKLSPETIFGQPAFFQLLRDQGPFELFCHHAAEATNYKSPDFDVHAALRANTLNLRAVLAALKAGGTQAVLLTGSVFENDEGIGNEPMRAFSGYGLAKGLTWQMFRFYCQQEMLRLGKFVIPNPFGPFEEPRFTAYLMNSWKQGKGAAVRTPDYVRDNIPVDLLASAYVQFAERLVKGVAQEGEAGSEFLRLNPSCYAETQGSFARRLAEEVRARTPWPCALELMEQEDFSEPLARTNREPARTLVPGWNESKAWDAFVAYYAS